MRNATVKDYMTTPIVVVRPGASFREMAATLHRYRVSAFPVLDETDGLVGLVSEADLLSWEAVALSRAARDGTAAAEPDDLTAADLMSRPVVTTSPDSLVENAARLMYNCRVKRLPVVDARGFPIGIISRADVLAALSEEEDRR